MILVSVVSLGYLACLVVLACLAWFAVVVRASLGLMVSVFVNSGLYGSNGFCILLVLQLVPGSSCLSGVSCVSCVSCFFFNGVCVLVLWFVLF